MAHIRTHRRVLSESAHQRVHNIRREESGSTVLTVKPETWRTIENILHIDEPRIQRCAIRFDFTQDVPIELEIERIADKRKPELYQ